MTNQHETGSSAQAAFVRSPQERLKQAIADGESAMAESAGEKLREAMTNAAAEDVAELLAAAEQQLTGSGSYAHLPRKGDSLDSRIDAALARGKAETDRRNACLMPWYRRHLRWAVRANHEARAYGYREGYKTKFIAVVKAHPGDVRQREGKPIEWPGDGNEWLAAPDGEYSLHRPWYSRLWAWVRRKP